MKPADLVRTMATTRLANATFVRGHRPLSDLMVAPPPLDGLLAAGLRGAARGLRLAGAARFHIARRAGPAAAAVAAARGAAPVHRHGASICSARPARRSRPNVWSRSWSASRPGRPRPTPWELLQRTLPGHGPVGAYLDGAKQDSTLPAFADFWASFTHLAGLLRRGARFRDPRSAGPRCLSLRRLGHLAGAFPPRTRSGAPIRTAASCSARTDGWRTSARSRSGRPRRDTCTRRRWRMRPRPRCCARDISLIATDRSLRWRSTSRRIGCGSGCI